MLPRIVNGSFALSTIFTRCGKVQAIAPQPLPRDQNTQPNFRPHTHTHTATTLLLHEHGTRTHFLGRQPCTRVHARAHNTESAHRRNRIFALMPPGAFAKTKGSIPDAFAAQSFWCERQARARARTQLGETIGFNMGNVDRQCDASRATTNARRQRHGAAAAAAAAEHCGQSNRRTPAVRVSEGRDASPNGNVHYSGRIFTSTNLANVGRIDQSCTRARLRERTFRTCWVHVNIRKSLQRPRRDAGACARRTSTPGHNAFFNSAAEAQRARRARTVGAEARKS